MKIAAFVYQQQLGILVFTSVLFIIMLSNLLGMRRVGSKTKTRNRKKPIFNQPFISVLIPARNEARNIDVCIRSLLSQDYSNYEILVLDDQSEDGTDIILDKLVQESERLKILHGKPLPQDWLGKNWACHQLSQIARGDYFLFVDADTYFHSRMLTDTMALAIHTRADFLSGITRQETNTWAEILAVPMIPWMEHTILPVALVRALPIPFLVNAIGQFMLFHRSAYEKIGGHASVRDNLIEDFALSRRIKSYGLHWDLVDVSKRVTTHMYLNFMEVWNGFSRNLFAAFGYNLLSFGFIWSWMLLVTYQPIMGLLMAFIGFPLPGFVPTLALLIILMQMTTWLVSAIRFRFPVYQALLYPLTITLFVAIAVRSFLDDISRTSITWKGRVIGK